MKIIPLHNKPKVEKWIREIQKNNSKAQKELYNHFSPTMLAVCRRYINDLQFAEDCMIKGFVKVFKNSTKYKNKGSFEGWVRRIMVNECLTFLRLQKRLDFLVDNDLPEQLEEKSSYSFDAQEILDALPEGYRVVFNLFVFEEMSHKDIANVLNISESTSKSQLFKAKKKLKNLFKEQEIAEK